MYFYRRNFSCIFRNITSKKVNSYKNNKFIFGNKSFYSNILDNRLKSSLESIKFTKNINNNNIFPRYDQVNKVLSKYNISLVGQSVGFTTNSSNTIELSSEDELPEMTDEAISVESTKSAKNNLEPNFINDMESKSKTVTNIQENNVDVKGTFKGHSLIGKEHGSVYTKHEPTMFGDWSHMGRVTDF